MNPIRLHPAASAQVAPTWSGRPGPGTSASGLTTPTERSAGGQRQLAYHLQPVRSVFLRSRGPAITRAPKREAPHAQAGVPNA